MVNVMTDQELLVYAAKAIDCTYDVERDVLFGFDFDDGNTFEQTGWNPLENDGDAFRLAAELLLSIHQYRDYITVDSVLPYPELDPEKPWGDTCPQNCDQTDRTRVIRRTIVKVAAEIGRVI